jgi:integrase/recombinase XerD
MAGLITFLRHFGFSRPLAKKDMPRYTDKVISAYNLEELKRLFDSMTSADRLAYQFFLGSGAREQEVSNDVVSR